jgi:putative hydrolase of the HAD superfamily
MDRYKAILFDLDGTLIDFRACEFNSLKSAVASAGISFAGNLTWEKFWETYTPLKSYYWGKRTNGELTREEAIENSIRDTLVTLGLEQSPLCSIAKTYVRSFVRANYLQPGVHETLRLLKDRVALGLVTNGYRDAQRGRAEASGLVPYFETIVVSEEVGCEKPDPRIFEIALCELDMKASDALYVGDSIEYDYKGALAAGIDFCLYDPLNARPDLNPEPILRITTLRQLVRHIELED